MSEIIDLIEKKILEMGDLVQEIRKVNRDIEELKPETENDK